MFYTEVKAYVHLGEHVSAFVKMNKHNEVVQCSATVFSLGLIVCSSIHFIRNPGLHWSLLHIIFFFMRNNAHEVQR